MNGILNKSHDDSFIIFATRGTPTYDNLNKAIPKYPLFAEDGNSYTLKDVVVLQAYPVVVGSSVLMGYELIYKEAYNPIE